MPLVALLLGLQRYLTSFTGIGYGIIGKIAEHTVEQTAVTLHDNMLVGQEDSRKSSVRLLVSSAVSWAISLTICVMSTASKSIISEPSSSRFRVEMSRSREVRRSLWA